MKHLSVLVPKGLAIIDTIIGSMNLFQMANSHYRKQNPGKEDLFQIDIVGPSKDPHTYNRLFSVIPTKTIQEVKLNYDFVLWMKEQRIRHHAELASLCRGAFLLAETGLMHGKSCATHWLTHDKFRENYPDVNLLPDKIISEDNGIYSRGGAYSFLNLLLHLIEKY